MTRYKRRISFGVLGLLLFAGASHAQVASLGKGWLLDSGASITSAPGEVISGTNSIKGSTTANPNGQVNVILRTDPTFVHFAPNQSYTMTWSYHVITAPADGFGYGFQSPEGWGVGDFGPDAVLKAASGTSGTAATTFTLKNHGDYLVEFGINGTGSLVIDDIRITDTSGQLIASENAEGPSLAPGPLSFQVTDAMMLFTPAQGAALAVAAKDLDGDGHPETIMKLYGQPACSVPLPPIIIESSGQMRLATSDFFPGGAPTNNCTPMIRFADLNGDGLTDMIFADAGLDAPPWTGFRIGVALNLGGGKYRDVTSLIPADQQTTRSYAIAVGDIFGDGRVEIILPDENNGANTALLRWNGTGFDEIRNWVPQSIWSNPPAYLHAQSWMELADFDRDGRLDLLVTGQDHNPNFQIVFGGPGGFTAGTLVVLPDGPFGHTQGGPQPDGTLTTAEVSPVVVGDFNHDGLPDIFAVIRNITEYVNGSFVVGDSTYQMRLNQGSRRFVDVSPSPWVNLGRVEYQNLIAIDINNDGFLDVVGTYSTDPPPGTTPQWGTTLFLNDGTGRFEIVDGAQFIGVTTTPPSGGRWGLGSFVPTVVRPGRTEGIVYQSVGGCGTPGGCPAVGLNLYKVVANGVIGPPTISVSNPSVVEGNVGTVSAVFDVNLSGPYWREVAVDYATGTGSATAGEDYVAAQGRLVFPPGTTTRTVGVPVLGDYAVEGPETFGLLLSNPVNAGPAVSGLATIVDDDGAGFSVSDAVIAEPRSGTSSAVFSVTKAADAVDVSVGYRTADGSATAPADYVESTGTLTFVAGQTSQTIVVPVKANGVGDAPKMFYVDLESSSGPPIARGRGTATIYEPGFYPVAPCRILDTRLASQGPALSASSTRTLVVGGSCAVPTGATAASLNVTVVGPTGGGDLRIFPAGVSLPLVSAINYTVGQTRANNITVQLNSRGLVSTLCEQPTGTVDLIVDVNGYFW